MLTVKEHWKGRNSYSVHGEGVDAIVRCRSLPEGRNYITIQGKGERTHRLEIEEAVLKFKSGKKENGGRAMNEIPDEVMVTLMNAVSMEIGRHVEFIEQAQRAPHAEQLKQAIEDHEQYLAKAKAAKQWLDENKSWRL